MSPSQTRTSDHQHLLHERNNGLRRIGFVLPDCYLRSLIFPLLGQYALNFRFENYHVHVDVEFGVHLYSLRPGVAHAIWQSLVDIATFIVCAGNNFNPRDNPTKPLPISIPEEALRDIELKYPIIALVLTCRDENVLCHRFETRSELNLMVSTMRHVANYYVSWVAEALKRSIRQGLSSHWNWGAAFGLDWLLFLLRVGPIAANPHWISLQPLIEEYDEDSIETSLAIVIRPTATLVFQDTLVRSTIGHASPDEMTELTAAMGAFGLFERDNIFVEPLPEYSVIDTTSYLTI
ncbi:hypothetical protein GALMADRAFT_208052 [Galerina marginata CBS 339.88]|uniref:Uncharacterized protein n=1 Tax=Galerina marginata (strain CBS 339.88) TaxID=685588 RepID=A0A067TFX1_GALM3|nr:hypothetical protein GALMADRAFT_208052 [Galerina marginata CBS 339.88]